MHRLANFTRHLFGGPDGGAFGLVCRVLLSATGRVPLPAKGGALASEGQTVVRLELLQGLVSLPPLIELLHSRHLWGLGRVVFMFLIGPGRTPWELHLLAKLLPGSSKLILLFEVVLERLQLRGDELGVALPRNGEGLLVAIDPAFTSTRFFDQLAALGLQPWGDLAETTLVHLLLLETGLTLTRKLLLIRKVVIVSKFWSLVCGHLVMVIHRVARLGQNQDLLEANGRILT
mmetsp:Transcript_9415/g.21504  ORF Transcript_9415/g.21504 Transcript_9415/m.21504 type:complete len:232 (+) Transcript_9415:1007-1702(+)